MVRMVENLIASENVDEALWELYRAFFCERAADDLRQLQPEDDGLRAYYAKRAQAWDEDAATHRRYAATYYSRAAREV